MDSTTQAVKQVKELYDKNLEEFVTETQAIGWKSNEQLEMRYKRLLSVVSDGDKAQGASFNDYGCGYGAMISYMNREGFQINGFNGYDISQDMLDQFKKEYTGDEFKAFCQTDIITPSDYSVVCGTLNVRFKASDSEWNTYIKETLAQLDQNSKKGFSFNLLTSYVDWKEDHLYYGDPLEFFDYCKTHFSKRVTLYHEDPLYEWVIVVKKED